jgi:probable rRNA maturation factor
MPMSKRADTLRIDYCTEDPRWKLKALKPKTYKAVQATLQYTGYYNFFDKCSLTILLAGDAKLQELNKDFRKKNQPTNVLSFPAYSLKEGNFNPMLEGGNKTPYIGDVAVSYDCVYIESNEQVKEFMNHYLHLIIHSVLHLLGYDHIKLGQAKKMENLEIKILSHLGISNPYEV